MSEVNNKRIPTLHMTVGIQGSGKSTWAKAFVASYPGMAYVNPDTIWNEIGNISDRSLGGAVYSIAFQKTREALSAGKDVLVDATFVKRKWRRDFLKIAQEFGARKHAYVFDIDLETAIKRVETRSASGGMNVPREAIELYHGFLKNTPPSTDEFDNVKYI